MASTVARPLAFGMWTFSLPGTDRLWLLWDGPGAGLYLACASAMRPVQHPCGLGPFATRKEAQRAAETFIRLGSEEL